MHSKPASTSDINRLRYLGIQTYKDHFSDLWSDSGIENYLNEYFSIQALRNSLNNPESTWLLFAENDSSEATGFAQINWQRASPLGGYRGAELQKIYFLAGSTGKGLGRFAFNEIQTLAANNDEALIWLDVLASNTRAQDFYRRQGFTIIGNTAFATDLKEVGYVVMVKFIS